MQIKTRLLRKLQSEKKDWQMNLSKVSLAYAPTAKLVRVNEARLVKLGFDGEKIREIQEQVQFLNEPRGLHHGKTEEQLSTRQIWFAAVLVIPAVLAFFFLLPPIKTIVTYLFMGIETMDIATQSGMWWAPLSLLLIALVPRGSHAERIVWKINDSIEEIAYSSDGDNPSLRLWKLIRGTQMEVQNLSRPAPYIISPFIENLNATAALREKVIQLAEAQGYATRNSLNLWELGEEFIAFESSLRGNLGDIHHKLEEILGNAVNGKAKFNYNSLGVSDISKLNYEYFSG